MEISSYLSFNGNCKQAIDFYARVFECEPIIMTYGDAPPEEGYETPEEIKQLIMHGNLNIDGNQLMFSDFMPGLEFICGNNISLTLNGNDKELLTKYFESLAKDGTVTMPLEKTFWSELFGMVTDQFGINWQISHTE